MCNAFEAAMKWIGSCKFFCSQWSEFENVYLSEQMQRLFLPEYISVPFQQHKACLSLILPGLSLFLSNAWETFLLLSLCNRAQVPAMRFEKRIINRPSLDLHTIILQQKLCNVETSQVKRTNISQERKDGFSANRKVPHREARD